MRPAIAEVVDVFRVDEQFGVQVPLALANEVGDAGYYRAVEATNHGLIWVLHLEEKSAQQELPGRWRRLFVARLNDALQLLGLEQWSERRLLVMIPPHMSASNVMSLARCQEVWECAELDDEICWRIETAEGPLLDSLYGSAPGQERRRYLLWSDPNRCESDSD